MFEEAGPFDRANAGNGVESACQRPFVSSFPVKLDRCPMSFIADLLEEEEEARAGIEVDRIVITGQKDPLFGHPFVMPSLLFSEGDEINRGDIERFKNF